MTSFTNPEVTYNTTIESCDCKSFEFGRGKPCKHIRTLRREINHVTVFNLLRLKYDCRLNGDETTRRCYYEMQMASGF